MSLDDLLPILFVAFFVVNAFLRGGRRSRRSKGKGQQGKGQSTRAGTPGSSPSPGGGQASTTSTPEAPPERSFSDDLAKRLEEARRRVQQAGRGDASSSTASSTASSSTSSASAADTSIGGSGSRSISGVGSSPAPPPSRPPPSFLGREGRASNEPEPTSQSGQGGFLGREGPRPRRAPKRALVATTPTSKDDSATLRAAGTIGFEPNDLVRGVIWSEVLGPPIAARTWRRPASRRPSR